jgi:hypothetical protein
MGIASYAPSTALEAGKNVIVEFFYFRVVKFRFLCLLTFDGLIYSLILFILLSLNLYDIHVTEILLKVALNTINHKPAI